MNNTVTPVNSNSSVYLQQQKPKKKGASYYTYSADKYNFSKNNGYLKMIGAETLGAISLALGCFVFKEKFISKYLNKISNKALKSVADWSLVPVIAAVSAFSSVLITRKALTNKTRLHPIPEEQQIKKEDEIRNKVTDLAKQKNITLSGIGFYDFRNVKGYSFALACFDIRSGYLLLNSKFKDTDLSINEVMPFIVHELTHAKQFENIAKDKDGIYNLNESMVKKLINNSTKAEKDKLLKIEYSQIPDAAIANLKSYPENYILVNTEIDEKNEINRLKAIKMCLENPNISKYDLPMVIDENYYKKAINGKPPLTPEESEKVKSYLDYMKDKHTIGKLILPMNIYLQDPIEKEAYTAQFKYKQTGKID